ncbi:MAG: immunoglobulin domain-containing protein [Planctomycetes bacterium]|nr:immunoglobulin domain-containing protein [Planctomycetota bacterium]
MKPKVLLAILFVISGQPAAGLGAWVVVGDGIEYQAFTAPGPNNLFVTRVTRSTPNATIDTSIAYDRMAGAKETVRNQAARQDDAITWWGGSWGARNQVVAAINGGFYNVTTGVIDGGQIQSGWYAHWFADKGAFSGFAWKTDRTAFHGECVDHTAAKVYVRFVSSGANQTIDGINRNPGSSDLVIFTPQYDNRTPSGTRTEVLVEMSRPNLTTSGAGYSAGTIRSVAQNTGSTWIPFDHLVLSADGSAGTTLRNNATVGSQVRIFQELIETNEPTVQGTNACQTETGVNWSNVFASINSNYHFLKNNVVRVPDAVAHPSYQGYVNLNPRTAICWNPGYVFFVVCDGRSSQSVGMSCATLGEWAKSTLGATDGVNLDGGGSSTMVVNGSVVNNPSDGSERSVCNGVMMVNVQPKLQSAQFTAGQTVHTLGPANCRLGPGTNYGIITTLSSGAQGAILTHAIMGVYAKGYYWWKCDFGGTIGWVAQSLLTATPGATPPSITQHPSNQTVSPGGTAAFTVTATGDGTLSYLWQKNGSNLADGGHYSGATTATLTISSADGNDVASYRCVVWNAYGSATSNPATLTVTTCSAPTLVNGDFEGGNTGGVGNDWTGYQRAPDPTTVWSIQTASPPTEGGLQYQQIANTSSTGGGGVRQDVTGCGVGATYTIAGWMRTNSASATCTVKCSPSASTNWATAVDLSPPQTTTSNAWVPFSGTVTAAGTSMTIWLDGQTGGTGLNKASCFDSITVTGCTPVAAPTITQQPATQNVCSGGPAVFSVGATGEAPLSFQWQKNQANLSNGGHYSGATTATLTVSNADGGDVASYRCVVSNGAGSTNSNAANLTLKAATAITQHPQPQSVSAGGTATFTVAATGDGTLSYQWQKNSANLVNGGHYSGVTTPTLTISSADSNDAANYRCVVTAGCGSATSNQATLTVGPASLPGDFDHDNDVDQEDFAHLQLCLDAATAPPPDPNCADANLDNDPLGTVTQDDLMLFLQYITGPGIGGNPD